MIWDKSVLKLYDQVPITIYYEKTTNLTTMHDYNIIYRTVEYLYMTGCVTRKKKHNLNHLEKLLRQWHFKLGHTGFSTFQWIERKIWLVNMGEDTGRNNVNITKCVAFQYGNQERNTKYGTRQSNDK